LQCTRRGRSRRRRDHLRLHGRALGGHPEDTFIEIKLWDDAAADVEHAIDDNVKKRKRFLDPDLAVLHPRDQMDAALPIMPDAKSSLPEELSY